MVSLPAPASFQGGQNARPRFNTGQQWLSGPEEERERNMNWLIALAGFAGIMAVFSTVVTIGVEATHKFLASRRNGLMEMMRSLHENVVIRLDPADGRASPARDARAFAAAMVRSPSSGGRGFKLTPWSWGLNILHHRFERLSKRQFAEQLAQTEFGSRLAGLDRSAIQRTLGQLAYEFDRHGAAQSDYFRRRAKVYSAFIAFFFVAFGNINAIEIYKHLAGNEAATSRIIPLLEQPGLIPDAEIRLAAAGPGSSDEIARDYLQMIERLQADTALPIGRGYFPFCEPASAPPQPDPRCADDLGSVSVFGHALPGWAARAFHRDTYGDWVVWFLSIVTTAGLLGLGAPFWFELFSKTASLATGQTVRLRQEAAQAAAPLPAGMRGAEETDIAGMTEAFLIAAGRPERAYASVDTGLSAGMRLGAASADAARGAPGSLGLRMPPGAVDG